MKKILFLLFLPTLLFPQKVIKNAKNANNKTQIDISKWAGKVVNFDSIYKNINLQRITQLGDYRYKGRNITRFKIMAIRGIPKLGISFVEGLGIGETDLDKKDLPFIVKENYSFAGSIFKGTTAFNGTHFLKGFQAYDAKFLGATSFEGAIFNGETSFDSAYFDDIKIDEPNRYPKLFDGRVTGNDTISTVVFSLCEFDYLSMRNAIFDSSVDFIDVAVHGSANFSRCKFNKNVRFTRSKFYFNPNFTEVFFGGKVDFNDVVFQDELSTLYNYKPFEKAVFEGVSSWERAVLSDTTDFSNATFKQTANFNQTQLPIYLNLTNLNLKELNTPIRFDLASTDSLQKRWGNGQKCHVYLNTFTDISKIVLDASKFTIVFDSAMKYDDKIGVFEQVIKKCKEIGFGESTKGFDIELQKLQLRHGYPIIGNFLIWLNDYWWNFGYEKSKIFRNTGIAFLLSFLIFFFRLPDYARVYFPSQMGISDEMASKLHLFTWMRFRVALFYTALIFFTWKMEHGEVNYRNYPLKTLIIYTVFTIGIIHLAYLAGAVISR